MNLEETLKKILETLEKNIENNSNEKNLIPIGISNRHVHLCEEHINILFGEKYELTKLKDLSQLGQYACKETVIICGPKGSIEKVRVLGPKRKESQIEVSAGDCIGLGIKSCIKLSGDLKESSALVLVGPKGSVQLRNGVIVAQRHIHMNQNNANELQVKDGELVSIEITGIRGGILNNTCVRVDDSFSLECHLDVEEANAMGLSPNSKIKIIKK